MTNNSNENNALEGSPRSSPRRDGETIRAVLDVMARLRDREAGCPWDKEQTFATIAPYTIEEAYEVADAIERKDMPGLKEELGDLLFQVAFHARMAEEQGAFDFADVANALAAKMIARHPHVFGDVDMRTAEEQTRAWEAQKAEERARKRPNASLLDDVAMALPALMRAEKLTKRAARINFDWPDAEAVLEKLEEELAELDEARSHADPEAMTEEMGDVLFVMSNLARKLGVDPEEALRRANAKFTTRFQHIERRLAEMGKTGKQPLDELEALWVEAKHTEKKKTP
ncbi:MAG TPA: nucleoside triphosphate pyrophosphohydrolase [Caulobacterales bacterium]|nr:nucleoside triphosphate pyrophosphohydrolase [Caulobacterales bacterium]